MTTSSKLHPTSVDAYDPKPLFCRTDLNKVIMNYLVNEGYKEVARIFCIETGLDTHLPLDSLENRTRIRNTLENGHVVETIALLNNLYPDLLINFHDLHFDLQKQHLVELIRAKEIEEALDFAQTQLAHHGLQSSEARTQLEAVMSLLAFDNPYSSPGAELLLESQRVKLASEVNAAILASSNQDSKTNLVEFYKFLLWAQHELDERKVRYERITDIASGTLDSSHLVLTDSEKL